MTNIVKQERVFKQCPDEDETLMRMYSDGFFLKNPNAETDEELMCFYWEPEQVQKYRVLHPDAPVWTIIEEEGIWYVVERIQYVNRLEYLIEAPTIIDKRYVCHECGSKYDRTMMWSEYTCSNCAAGEEH